METKEPAYLGDGVYATFDGEYIWLTTQREEGGHRVALDLTTFGALVAFARRTGWEVC